MNHHTPQSRRLLAATASLAAMTLALAASPTLAQTATAQPDDQADEVEEIVVTGFRASLANALNIKRRETGMVDAISAEDIADFPDTNLAESIQRIPGVSIDRDAGEGRTITVRGLGPDFTRTRINGIEAQATTGATDSSGSVNRGRGFDFNVFASELFNNITVRKTASAEVEEGSLGATVDLRTSRPFDSGGANQTVLSAQYGWNDLSEEWSPRYAGLISRTWMDGRLGALASLAYSDKDSIEEGFSSVRWGPANGDNGFQNGSVLGSATTQAGLFHPRIPRYGRLTHGQERLGGTLSLQARPNSDRTLFTFDALYSKLDSTRNEQFLEAWSLSRNASQGGKPQVDIVDYVVDPETGELVYMKLDDMDLRTESRFDQLETTFQQYTFNVEHEFTDNLKFSGTVGRSKSEFANPLQVNAIIDRQDTDGYSWDFRQSRDLPLIVYGFDVANPASWSFTGPAAGAPQTELRLSSSYQTNIYTTAEGGLEWMVTDNLTLKGGASYKEFISTGTGYARTSNVAPALPAGTSVASVTGLLTGFGRGLDLPAGSATSWVVPDLEALRALWKWDCNCNTGVAGGDFRLLGLDNGSTALANWREVTEKDTGFWVQADWNMTLGNMPFRGNVGVRQVKTEIDSLGFSAVGGVAVAAPGSHEYDDTLPSLNMSLEPFENVMVRFGAAKVMARPPVTSLIPVFTLSALTAPNPSASLGNVELEPFRAKTYDLSFEWYFAPESLLSFAYFYKDISTYVQTTIQNLTYAQLTALNPVAFPAGGGRDPNQLYVYSTPTNSEGGPLKGWEVSYQQPFRFLPGFLSNLGTQLNYTHVESEIEYCTTAACTVTVPADLVNLSPNAWNATLYYDDGKLNARVSAAYRDGYYQQIPAANGGSRGIAVTGKSETLSIDASASYQLTDKASISIEGINLTDEPNRQYHGELGGNRDSTYVYHHTGRQVFAGIRYKF